MRRYPLGEQKWTFQALGAGEAKSQRQDRVWGTHGTVNTSLWLKDKVDDGYDRIRKKD